MRDRPPPTHTGTSSPELDATAIEHFRSTVYDHYRRHGRDMPWRHTADPYAVLVSEVMLQQTQVPRVTAKYGEFLVAFPDVQALAQASLTRVLAVWQGLGYNRRALALHRLAQQITTRYEGAIPSDVAALQTLPGIGPATACAIAAFAFNKPVVFIETNIRSVFLHHFFSNQIDVRDRQILSLVERCLDRANPRLWYWALMDYGAHLKVRLVNPGRRSSGYRTQSRFEGSNRQLRGRILRWLTEHGPQLQEELHSLLGAGSADTARVVGELAREEFVLVQEGRVRIK